MKRLEARHWAFLGLAVVVIFTMLLGIQPDVTPTGDTLRMYEYINSLPSGSVLMVSFDHEASSLPEISPLAVAFLRHAFSKGHRMIGVALLAEGTGVGYNLMQQTAREYDREYDIDYVYLGFKPQYIAAMLSMGESIRNTYPEDYSGNKYEQLEMLRGISNYDDIAGVISIADGSLTTHWMEYAGARYGVRISAFVTAAMVTSYDPYLASGQMHNMVGGLRGAAEYEKLIGAGGGGMRAMLAQTISHIYIILLIIVGNIIYFSARSRGKAA